MNRAAFIVTALLLASTAWLAEAADRVHEKPVVVDPMDLRTPVPDPEKQLTEKYDGRSVAFTGNLHSAGQDASTKERWYTLAVQAVQEQSSPTAKPKMQTVVVKVYFAANERRLPTRSANYTVQGTGEMTVDGSLIIRNAQTMSLSPTKPASGR
jgi:hypothetical protein